MRRTKREANELVGQVPKYRGGSIGEHEPAPESGRPGHRKADIRPRRKRRGGTGPSDADGVRGE